MSVSNNKNSICRIVVDAMGGDFAPQNVVLGTALALKENKNFQVILVGNKTEIIECLNTNNISFNHDDILHTSQVIDMHDHAASSIKNKQDSSIVQGAKLVKDKKADAFVSAGNTGAVMAASTLIMGRIKGISRPTIGALMPSLTGQTLLYDVGANVDSKPQHLFEWAIMGSIYAQEMLNISNPSVAILNIGEEETKGNQLTFEATELIKKTNLNFIGNVEGRDILKGTANVVVCDGYTGNIVLKFGESVLTFLKQKFRDYASEGFTKKLKIGLVKSSFKEILGGFDYQTHGGVPLLGVNGISIIGHGASSPEAIKNMILKAFEMYEKDLTAKIESSINIYTKK